jgi:4-hydroxyphenylpyruvate dioxygenase
LKISCRFTDYVEFYVGNAKQSAHYYKTAFGYQSYAGLETGVRENIVCLKQDKIRIVLTTPLTQDPFHEHLRKHGDGVK